MTAAEKNYHLLQEIEANRRFLLMAYRQNPKMLASAEARIGQLLEAIPPQQREVSAGKVRQSGISLIELIMFIVIVSVSLAGILTVMNLVTRSSADPLIHKQALAIAESLMEEVQLRPFTFCDPDDANFQNAASSADCATTIEVIGAETIGGVTEIRLGGANLNERFDNVSDYDAFVPGAVVDINGIAAPAGYIATVAVEEVALGAVPATESLHITVSVTGPDGVPIRIDGYRTRYAPGSGP